MQKYPSFEDYYKMVPKDKNDTLNYNLRGFYESDPKKAMEFIKPDTHAPDRFKLPNHPTFSDESMYHNEKTTGGKWAFENGKDVFYASPFNIKSAGGADKLQKYINEKEPNSKLIIPK